MLVDQVSTCTAHSGAKKAHDWAVEQLADLFRTTHRVKTQQVAKSRGQRCRDFELADNYLTNVAGPVSLVLDLRIVHERWGSSSNPSLDGHLHYPSDIDRTLNEAAADKILQYRADYDNRPSNTISFMLAIPSTVGHLHCEFVGLYFYRLIGKLTAFLQLQEFSYRKPTSTSVAWRSPHSSSLRSETSSSRLQHCGLY